MNRSKMSLKWVGIFNYLSLKLIWKKNI
jgi:hypothetical protein